MNLINPVSESAATIHSEPAEAKKVVIIGPESTGKSTLCRQLAQHYNTAWVPEFARQYLLTNGTTYTFNDLLIIAKGQIALEEEHLHHSPLFIDTDMYVMKVWCEYVFQQCHQWILDQIAERTCHLYLLCNIDLPWVRDELREYPDLEARATLYHMYKDLLINQAVPWIDISGNYEQRFRKSVEGVSRYV